MDRLQNPEAVMNKCDVCGNTTFHVTRTEEVFNLDGHFVLVEHIPARICDRCGDASFDRETTENIRRMVHGHKQAERTLNVDVFAYT